MENQSNQIAKTIQEQLLALSGVNVMSWGAHAWAGGKNFLQFKVQGFKFKGTVKITLMPNDTYKIEFIKNELVEKEFTDVYFDEMDNVIDNYVEYTGPNYESDVRNAVYNFHN